MYKQLCISQSSGEILTIFIRSIYLHQSFPFHLLLLNPLTVPRYKPPPKPFESTGMNGQVIRDRIVMYICLTATGKP